MSGPYNGMTLDPTGKILHKISPRSPCSLRGFIGNPSGVLTSLQDLSINTLAGPINNVLIPKFLAIVQNKSNQYGQGVLSKAELESLCKSPKKFPFPLRRVECGKIFVGSKGITLPLHFDTDFRHNILVQIEGKKRVLLLPPPAAASLKPIGSNSSLKLCMLTSRQKDRFLSNRGGAEIELQAGDAVFVPACWWHEVEYVEAGLSLGLRFGSGSASRKLAILPPNLLVQNLAYELQTKNFDNTEVEPKIVRDLLRVFFQPNLTPARRKEIILNRILSFLDQEAGCVLKKAQISELLGNSDDFGEYDPDFIIDRPNSKATLIQISEIKRLNIPYNSRSSEKNDLTRLDAQILLEQFKRNRLSIWFQRRIEKGGLV